jgi:hypothetical protein
MSTKPSQFIKGSRVTSKQEHATCNVKRQRQSQKNNEIKYQLKHKKYKMPKK